MDATSLTEFHGNMVAGLDKISKNLISCGVEPRIVALLVVSLSSVLLGQYGWPECSRVVFFKFRTSFSQILQARRMYGRTDLVELSMVIARPLLGCVVNIFKHGSFKVDT